MNETDILSQVFTLVQTSGYLGIGILAMWLIYKTTLVGLISISIYKAFKLIVTASQSRTLSARIAAEMKTKTPMTSLEEAIVLEAVRKHLKIK